MVWAASVVQVRRVHHLGWLQEGGEEGADVKKAITVMGIG